MSRADGDFSEKELMAFNEILSEVPKNELNIVHGIVSSEMEKAIDLNVPIKVDSNYGASWFEAH